MFMKICLYTMCLNEEIILPFFLDYYTNYVGVDKIVFYDGGSTDNSHKIINSYPNTELILEHDEVTDSKRDLRIWNEEWKKDRNDYDWMIVCTTDEFLYHPNIRKKLLEYKNKGITIPHVEGFDMISITHPNFEKGKYLHTKIKRGIKDPIFMNKNIIFNPKELDINYRIGCHACNPVGNVIFDNIEEFKLLHFKRLSYEFLLEDSRKKDRRRSQWMIDNNAGYHYKTNSEMSFDEYKKSYDETRIVLSSIEIDNNTNLVDEELKIQQLRTLEKYMEIENEILLIGNEKIISINSIDENGKCKFLIPYLIDKGYQIIEKIEKLILSKKKDNPIYVFSHNYLINNWSEILTQQLNKIDISGLYKNATKLFLFAFGDDEQWNLFQNLVKLYDKDGKIEIKRHDDNFYEYHTLQHMWNFCQENEESYISYFHLKGVWSRHNIQTGDNDELDRTKAIKSPEALLEWKNCLEYFNIERWYNNVDKLKEGYDVVGALYNYNPDCPLFTGNFWWANSSYIKKLEYPQFIKENEPHHVNLWVRIKCEKWINSIKNNFYNFYNPRDLDLYHVIIKPDEYRDDINPLISIITSAYKKHEELKEAIQSVINQTYTKWEMLICTDGYDDITKGIVDGYNRSNIVYSSTERTNDYGSTQKNILTQTANGKYLIYLDDDNIIYPNYLEKIVKNFNKSTGMIICHIDYDGLDYTLPDQNRLALGRIDTLCLCVDKYYTKHAIWKNYAGQDYEFMKICENNILNHNKLVKFIPDILGRHTDKSKIIIKEKYKNMRINELLSERRLTHFNSDDDGVNRLFGLKDLIEKNLNQDSVVCEIGSFEGKSSELFALLTKKIYCIDPWMLYDQIENGAMGLAEIKFDNMSKKYDNIIKIKNFSVKAAEKFDDKSLDCVYLDGRHDYEPVKEDILTWIPKIKDGGIICGHDYHWEDVRIAVKEIFKDLPLKPSKINHPFYHEDMKHVEVYSDQSWVVNIDEYRKYSMKKEKDIIIFHHNYLRFNWLNILTDQIKGLKSSGLYDSCKEIVATIFSEYVDDNNRKIFKDFIKNQDTLNKWVIIDLYKNEYEYDILKTIKKYCDYRTEDINICYFHLKGVCSEQLNEPNIGIPYWRKYLNYFTINKWKDNVDKLKDYDIVGLDYDFNQMHQQLVLGGHFFWTKSEYVRKLDEPVSTTNRYLPEIWITSKECKVYSNFNIKSVGVNNLYLQPVYESLYKKIEDPKIVYVITSHPNYKMSEDITIKTLENIKSFGEKIILSAHCPVSTDIQKIVDYFVYDKNNPLIKHDFYTQSWFTTDEYYALLDITKNDNNLNHALGVFLNYYNSLILAKQQGFKTAVCTNFDMVFSAEDKKVIDSKIEEMMKTGKKAFFMNTPEREGIHYKTIFFITNIDFFIETFKYVNSEEIYTEEMKKVDSNTNCLENFFYHSLKDKNNLLLQEINEEQLFPTSEINLFSLIEYNTILPVEGCPNCFVIWFSSANSLDSRDFNIVVKKNGSVILNEIKQIDKKFIYYKRVKFTKGDNFEIRFKITQCNEVLKNKIIVVNDDIFANINSYGKFIDKINSESI